MSASFIINGDGTISFRFEYTAQTQNIQDAANDAAEHLFKEGWFLQPDPFNPLSFDQLTNQQKLDLLDDFVKRSLLGIAKRRYITNSIEAAEISATNDTSTRYF